MLEVVMVDVKFFCNDVFLYGFTWWEPNTMIWTWNSLWLPKEAWYPKIMYLNVFNVSFCIHVVRDKFPSMDWSPLCRLDPRCHDSMLVMVKFRTSYCHDFHINCLNVAFLDFCSMFTAREKSAHCIIFEKLPNSLFGWTLL